MSADPPVEKSPEEKPPPPKKKGLLAAGIAVLEWVIALLTRIRDALRALGG